MTGTAPHEGPPRKFLWYLGSWMFWSWFVAMKLLMHWVEEQPVLQRAALSGYDAAIGATQKREAEHTSVIAITAEDVASVFGGRRPVPPDSLMKAIRALTTLGPTVLVVDVFTDDPAYSKVPLGDAPAFAVWAQSADTATGVLLPVLGGRTEAGLRSGFAAMLAEEDGLVRRVRLRFPLSETSPGEAVKTLPMAAVDACALPPSWCTVAQRLPKDTASIAMRHYSREPAFFTLSDALTAAKAGQRPDALHDRIVVLGFAEGSDQVATPAGIQPGPQVVADAIETLVDPRGAIRRMPAWLAWGLDIMAAILIAYLQFRFHGQPRRAALATLSTAIIAYFGSRLFLWWPGYWVSVVPVMVAMWLEQLLEQVRGEANATSPPGWWQWLRARFGPGSKPPTPKVGTP